MQSSNLKPQKYKENDKNNPYWLWWSSDDRSSAVELAKYGNLDYLVFECLAERTIGRETHKLNDPAMDIPPSFRCLYIADMYKNNIRIVSNMGSETACRLAMRHEALDLGQATYRAVS